MVQDRRMMDRIRLLLVGGDSGIERTVRELVVEAGGLGACRLIAELTVAATPEEARRCLDGGLFEAVLFDASVPDATNLDLARAVLELGATAPVVVFYGSSDTQVRTPAPFLRADDYLDKSRLDVDVFCRAVRYAVERFALKQALSERTREVERSRSRAQRIIEHVASAIVIVDPGGRVLYGNPAARELFDLADEDLVGKRLDLPAEGELPEMDVLRGDGSERTLEVRLVEIEWMGRNSRLATLHDVTQHKRLLRELDATRRRELQLKDEFLSHVSHELRTPLTVIQQYVSLMLDDCDDDLQADRRKQLQITMRNSLELGRMIEDLLEVTRADTGKLTFSPDSLEIGSIIAEALESAGSLAAAGALTVTVEIQDDLPLAYADRNRVRQVLVNLLGNAIKYGGTDVHVRVLATRDAAETGFVRIVVEDDGPGIAAEHLEDVFSHFFQAGAESQGSRKGLGLGLFICKQLIEQQGGRIWVESEPGRGAHFGFTLPVYSLEEMVAPFAAIAPDQPVTLLAITFRGAGGDPLQSFHLKYVDRMQGLLAGCIMADRDALLPKVITPSGTAVHFVLASTDVTGAQALWTRIQGQLKADIMLRGSQFTFACDMRPLAVPSPEPAADWRCRFAESVAATRDLLLLEHDAATRIR